MARPPVKECHRTPAQTAPDQDLHPDGWPRRKSRGESAPLERLYRGDVRHGGSRPYLRGGVDCNRISGWSEWIGAANSTACVFWMATANKWRRAKSNTTGWDNENSSSGCRN